MSKEKPDTSCFFCGKETGFEDLVYLRRVNRFCCMECVSKKTVKIDNEEI